MQIVDRKTFLEMPANTIFSKYSPCSFGDLQIMGGAYGENDFLCASFADAIKVDDSNRFLSVLLRAQESGEEVRMEFENYGRDGLYDNDQLFAVWDQIDVIGMIRVLLGVVAVSEEETKTILATIKARDPIAHNACVLTHNSIISISKNQPREAVILGMTLAFAELRNELFNCGE
jgi:hypothetical protein